MSPFEPLGVEPRWRIVYEIMREADVDTVITYGQLGEALGLDPDQDRHAIQMATRRAAKEHLEQDQRATDVVVNQGYRVVRAPERLGIAARYGRRAGRALARGRSTVANVDLSGVSDPEVRKALELTAQAFALQMDFNRRFAVKQSQLERALSAVTDSQATDRDEMARLRERVERLEREGSEGQ